MFLTFFQIANVMKQKIKVMFTHLQHFTTVYYTCKHVNKACTMNAGTVTIITFNSGQTNLQLTINILIVKIMFDGVKNLLQMIKPL